MDIRARAIGVAKASIENCWAVISDHARLGESPASGIIKCEVTEPGDPAPNGFGAIRRLHFAPNTEGTPEVCNHYWPPYMMGYEIVGEPKRLKGHQAIILLRPHENGTEILYHMTSNLVEGSQPRPGATGGAQKIMEGMVEDFIKMAEALEAKSVK